MIEMILLLYSFTLITGIGGWILQHAHSGVEVFVASLFAPLSLYLATRIFQIIGSAATPLKSSEGLHTHQPEGEAPDLIQLATAPHIAMSTIPTAQNTDPESANLHAHQNAAEVVEQPLAPDHSRIDVDRRTFLKLIATAGFGVFFASLLTKKAHAAFFGSLPGSTALQIKDSNGIKIDPAEKQPTDGYEITEIDDASSPAYYGFLHRDGAWYITREASDGSYRYAKGASAFSSNWTLRATLTYGYYNTVFA